MIDRQIRLKQPRGKKEAVLQLKLEAIHTSELAFSYGWRQVEAANRMLSMSAVGAKFSGGRWN